MLLDTQRTIPARSLRVVQGLPGVWVHWRVPVPGPRHAQSGTPTPGWPCVVTYFWSPCSSSQPCSACALPLPRRREGLWQEKRVLGTSHRACGSGTSGLVGRQLGRKVGGPGGPLWLTGSLLGGERTLGHQLWTWGVAGCQPGGGGAVNRNVMGFPAVEQCGPSSRFSSQRLLWRYSR